MLWLLCHVGLRYLFSVYIRHILSLPPHLSLPLTHTHTHTHTHLVLAYRDVAIRVGQTLVDTNRLKVVSSIESRFRDEVHLYLELGGDAYLPLEPENPKKQTVQGAPKWFHNLPQDGDSEYESNYVPRPRYIEFSVYMYMHV